MIDLVTVGKHENVILMEFGHGSIAVTTAKEIITGPENLLLFGTQEPQPIGTGEGEPCDDMDNIVVAMTFKNVASIDVVIRQLNKIREQLI